jgi:hypothetical protein
MDPQLKIDDSPTAAANFASAVPLLVTATRTSDTRNNNSNNSYMQGAFSVVQLTETGPQLATMKLVNLPNLDGDRAWQKPNIAATNNYYLLVAASEDNGQNNNPQVVAFVYDKTTLKPVTVTNSNRRDSTLKPTNLIELSGRNDGQQYGPHSIARVPGTDNAFVMGVQRNNNNAYVLRVDVTPQANGVALDVKYLNRVINNARHCRPDVVTNAADNGIGFLTSVEANNQPADIGVRALSFDLATGKVVKSVLVAASDPRNNKYAVQPNVADLGKYIGISYQLAQQTRNGNGHTGGSNLSMITMLDKTTLAPVGAPVMGAAPYARHAGSVATLWGPDGSEVPAVVSLAGSSTGTGKGFAQIIPVDTVGAKLGTKDPEKLYEMSVYSDVAGTVTRGKRNPNDQGRGFIYALGAVPNPGYNKGNQAFMPEIKTLIASAIQGYTSATTATLAARESIWLSLVPATWVPGQPTTPGAATPTPGTNPDGTGPLPRTNVPGTDTSPNAAPPTPAIPGGPSPDPGGGQLAGGLGGGANAGCGCKVMASRATSGGAAFLFAALGVLGVARRRRTGK